MDRLSQETGGMKEFFTSSAADTRQVAADFAGRIGVGDVIALHGGLGSGKTCFVQGLAEGVGIEDVVSSPTYLILHEYQGKLPLYHMDLYRLRTPSEILAFGFEEYMDSDGIVAIEWPEKALDILPEESYHVYFELGDSESQRTIRIEGVDLQC